MLGKTVKCKIEELWNTLTCRGRGLGSYCNLEKGAAVRFMRRLSCKTTGSSGDCTSTIVLQSALATKRIKQRGEYFSSSKAFQDVEAFHLANWRETRVLCGVDTYSAALGIAESDARSKEQNA